MLPTLDSPAYRVVGWTSNARCYTTVNMKTDEPRGAVITIRTKPSIKAAAVKKAAEEHRTLTAYLEWLILQDTKRRP